MSFEVLPNGLYHIVGCFHFKGTILEDKKFRVLFVQGGGYTFDLTPITDCFSIGFAEYVSLTLFSNKEGLVQIEFMTSIPCVVEKSLETEK